MREEEETRDMEGRLAAYFAAERDRLSAPADLWAKLEPRLGPQPRTSRWAGLLDGLWGARPQLATAIAAVLLLVGGVATWRVVFPEGEAAPATVAEIESAAPLQAAAEAPVAAAARDSTAPEAMAAPAPSAPAQTADAISPVAALASASGWRALVDERVSFEGAALSPLFAVVRDAEYLAVVYAMTGPDSLAGWSLAPEGVWVRSGAEERPTEVRVTDLAPVGGVTLGVFYVALSGEEAGRVSLGFGAVAATNPETGERRTLGEGMEWVVVPLTREEGGPEGRQTLLLRSGPCFTDAGVTLDLDGGHGCPQVSEGDGERAAAGFAGLDAGGEEMLRLVFHRPEPAALALLVDENGSVSVVWP